MEKNARAELIAALVTDKYSDFKDGDEAILEAASDARLEDFRTNAERHKTDAGSFTRLETEHRNVAARLKVAEERIKTNEQSLSEEDFLARAPATIKALVEAHKAQEDAYRAAMVGQLKELGENTEEELQKKTTAELKTLAAYARVEVPNYAGRGVPQERAASERNQRSFAPPDPYAAGLKALREKTVN